MSKGEEQVGKILSRRIAAMGLTRQFSAAYICGKSDKVGEGSWRTISYKDGTLKLAVLSNEQAYLLKVRSSEIISKINSVLGRDTIERIVFKIDD